jgi:hypothetical protein
MLQATAGDGGLAELEGQVPRLIMTHKPYIRYTAPCHD